MKDEVPLHLTVVQALLDDGDLELLADLLSALGLVLRDLVLEVCNSGLDLLRLKPVADDLLQKARVPGRHRWFVLFLQCPPHALTFSAWERLDHLQGLALQQEDEDVVHLPTALLTISAHPVVLDVRDNGLRRRRRELLEHLAV